MPPSAHSLADYRAEVLWRTQMPELPSFRDRELPDETDVVVVGGGYTGLSAARALARGGARVSVLEANELGYGASTRNGGIVHPGFKWSHAELLHRYGAGLGGELYRESLDGYRYLVGLIRDEGIDAELVERGHLELAYAPGHLGELEETQRSLAAAGIAASIVPRARLREEIGSDAYFGALAYEESGGLHPAKYFAGLANAAVRAGADLHEGVRARSVRREPGGRMVVATDRGSIRARDVVVGTNGYTDGLVPAPYEGRAWFLPAVGEWYRLKDRLAARGRA